MKKTVRKPKTGMDSISGLKREVQDLSVLLELSSAINSSLNLEEIMHRVMEILHEKMGMGRGTLTLLDTKTNELFIEVAHHLGDEEIHRGRYQVGEGVTGRVVEAGEPMIIPNVGKEPLFLNKTKSRGDLQRNKIAFICVPIKLDKRTIGALSVDTHFAEHESLEDDLRILQIISSIIAQAVRVHQLVEKEKESLQRENTRLKQELKIKFKPSNIIGESKRMADVYASIQLVSQTRATVLIRGESGTGKELVAHAIHYNSDRAEGPFIKVSCAALPETLLESELFGYERGAFTGAVARKVGRFELANKGTLFLDEIGDITPSTQIKLLRVLQEKEFERVGGTETIRTDLRLVAATNSDLEALMKEGKFREDLYYRLNVIPIFMPSLRERTEDIPLLFNHFLAKTNDENEKNIAYISDEAMDYLIHYAWPGNVRELENAITRAVILCKGDTITQELFPIPGDRKNPSVQEIKGSLVKILSVQEEVESGTMTQRVEDFERKMIKEVIRKTGGNQRNAAKTLGITERVLGYKIKKYGLK